MDAHRAAIDTLVDRDMRHGMQHVAIEEDTARRPETVTEPERAGLGRLCSVRRRCNWHRSPNHPARHLRVPHEAHSSHLVEMDYTDPGHTGPDTDSDLGCDCMGTTSLLFRAVLSCAVLCWPSIFTRA